MFPFPRHAIIAQDNKLFHTLGDAVHGDFLVHRFWTCVVYTPGVSQTPLMLHLGTSFNVIFLQQILSPSWKQGLETEEEKQWVGGKWEDEQS